MINKPFKGKISPTGGEIIDIIGKEGVKNGYHLGEKQKEFIKKAVELIAKNDESDNEDKINAISAPYGTDQSCRGRCRRRSGRPVERILHL